MKMKITFQKVISVQEIGELLTAYSFDPYSSNWKIPQEKAFSLRCKEIQSFLQENSETSIMAREGEKIKGFIGYQILDWDTAHFGFPVAMLNYLIAEDNAEVKAALLSYVDSWCKEKGVRLLCSRVASNDLSSIHALEKSGHRYMETRVRNFIDLHKVKSEINLKRDLVLEYSELSAEDLDKALALVPGEFSLSRFHQDPLTKDKADDLFVSWVRNSFHDKSKEKLALRINGEFAGFFIYYLKKIEELGLTTLWYDLAVVAPKYKGTGAGLQFYQHVLRSEQKNADFAEWFFALSNFPVFNIAAKLQSNFVYSELTFHKTFW
ncbi:hypothetical protein HYU08_01225 [Candidatus Woesearchaeota archaeon]|nr:hypothetical protein [Candidatus Woesearchaeota archaeon]